MAAPTVLRRGGVLMAGGGVFGFSAYLSYHFQRMEKNFEEKKNERPQDFSFIHNPCRNAQYDEVAGCYDDAIGKDELFTGINLLRRLLLSYHASGNLLEVAAGTARNISYYPAAVKRAVLIDSSNKMLDEAKQKAERLNVPVQFAFVQGDASKIDLPSDSFDTVVDTFGLCSYSDPVLVLKEMARVCKAEGKILLLEHGRSKTWEIVTRHLDKYSEQHAANWGCVWNRDLDAILEASDLEVLTLSKYHFGTTYYAVCRPKKISPPI